MGLLYEKNQCDREEKARQMPGFFGESLNNHDYCTEQVGWFNDPSELPWKPKLAFCPEFRLLFQPSGVAITRLPEVL